MEGVRGRDVPAPALVVCVTCGGAGLLLRPGQGPGLRERGEDVSAEVGDEPDGERCAVLVLENVG
ncbi:hypothetical protein SBV1_820024 [Verrucomicrobia bacterium]|nr:hypothetical protein SBV1_820024 [Verrucomicrobiota bacterium]